MEVLFFAGSAAFFFAGSAAFFFAGSAAFFFAGSAAFLKLGLELRFLASCFAAAAVFVAIRLDYIIRQAATTVSRTILLTRDDAGRAPRSCIDPKPG